MEHSHATALAFQLAEAFDASGHAVLDAMLDRLTVVELAALEFDWEFWAREKQKAPTTNWRFWGFLTGRGMGKTIAISKHINDEIERLGAIRILLVAQDEASSVDIQVNGPSGLIATAPPWNKPEFKASEMLLEWPNGAVAIVRTPEAPGKIRGLDYNLGWCTELQSWPVATRDEAWSNVRLSVRLGYARLLWDATPKRRHPILRELLAEAESSPDTHVVIRGSTHENAINLGPGYVETLEKKYGGTTKGKEELLGEMLADSESALVRQGWIDDARKPAPMTFVRKAIGVDIAVTTRKGNDSTGIVCAGAGTDGQAYVLANFSGKHDPPTWAKLVLDEYLLGKYDVVVVETNKGGNLVTQNLRAAAKDRNLRVIVLEGDDRRRHQEGVVYVREVHARGPKEDRAQPMATAYERGRVSHVSGVNLDTLEDTLTTWEPVPGARSPDDLDALTHAITELLSLISNKPDLKIGFVGIKEYAKQATRPSAQMSIAALFKAVDRGRI